MALLVKNFRFPPSPSLIFCFDYSFEESKEEGAKQKKALFLASQASSHQGLTVTVAAATHYK